MSAVILSLLLTLNVQSARVQQPQAKTALPEQQPDADSSLSNPRSKNFAFPAGRLFKAAQKAAAGHRVVLHEDEGLKELNDVGQEVSTFFFYTRIRGFTHGVIAEVDVEPIDGKSSKLTIFFAREGGTNVWIPSTSFEVRKLQLETRLEEALNSIETEKSHEEFLWETGGIDANDHYRQLADFADREHRAKLDEAKEEYAARIADLAQMPTSTFPAMVEAADDYFQSIARIIATTKDTH